MLKRYVKDSLVSYVFLLPVLIGIAVFTAYPIIMSLFYSFTNYNMAFATRFTFENYLSLFTPGTEACDGFTQSLGLTGIYVVATTLISIVLSYALALFLSKNIKGIRVIRLLCYLPCLIPVLASGIIWRDMFASNAMEQVSDYGIINTWFARLGLGPFTFFESASTSMPTLIFTGLWTVGAGMIMWIAAIGNVPPDLYESASLDGAGYFRKLFSITVPLTTNMLFYNLLTSLISGLQVFSTYAMFDLGKDESLYFVAIRIYVTAFNPGGTLNGGLACAMAWLLFLIIAVLTGLLFKTNKWVKYNDD